MDWSESAVGEDKPSTAQVESAVAVEDSADVVDANASGDDDGVHSYVISAFTLIVQALIVDNHDSNSCDDNDSVESLNVMLLSCQDPMLVPSYKDLPKIS